MFEDKRDTSISLGGKLLEFIKNGGEIVIMRIDQQVQVGLQYQDSVEVLGCPQDELWNDLGARFNCADALKYLRSGE